MVEGFIVQQGGSKPIVCSKWSAWWKVHHVTLGLEEGV